METLKVRLKMLEAKAEYYGRLFEALGIDSEQAKEVRTKMEKTKVMSLVPFQKGSDIVNPTNGSVIFELDKIRRSSIFEGSHFDTDAVNGDQVDSSLPATQDECNRILHYYYTRAWCEHPIVEDRETLYDICKKYYVDGEALSYWERFLISITLAIGLGITGEISATTHKFYYMAITNLKRFYKAIPVLLASYDDPSFNTRLQVRVVQSLLLVCNFGLLEAVSPGIWYIVSTAMRLVIDLDMQEESVLVKLDSVQQDHGGASHCRSTFHRRLFWVSYALDREISCHANRLFSLDDVDITSKMIVSTDELTIPFFFVKIRRLQSLVHKFVYNNAASATPSSEKWRQAVQVQMNTWLLKMLDCENSASQEVRDMFQGSKHYLVLTYFCVALQLYRPLSGISDSYIKGQMFELLFQAAQNNIVTYEKMDRLACIDYKYISVYQIYQAGLAYFYCLINYPQLSFRPNILGHCESFMERLRVLLAGCEASCPSAVDVSNTLQKIYPSTIDMIQKRLEFPNLAYPEAPILDSYGPFDEESSARLADIGAIPLIKITKSK